MNIVKRTEDHGDIGIQHADPGRVEPAFLSPELLVQMAKTTSAGKIIDYMAHQTVRNPANLQHHLNRIEIYSQQGESEGVYGALLDLFIVLQEKGLPLRKRLLEKFHSRLKPPHYSVLVELLVEKTGGHGAIPSARESMLGDNRVGEVGLLVKQESGSSPENRDPVEDARDLINSGQVAGAQTLLEKILLINPQRQDVGQELMIIYRHSRNHKAVEKVLQCTKNLSLALRDEWEALSMSLKSEADLG